MAGIVSGLTGIAGGIIGGKKRRSEQKTAQGLYDSDMAGYRNLDTSNPYANMENTMEDLTVNTQQADFAAQQQNQGLGNIMGSMNQAAGGSGIAALAQSLANQQSQNLQTASVSIGRQEQANQTLAATQAGKIQMAERDGDVLSREMQREQSETELGMSQVRLGAANQARTDATQALVQGIGQVGGGVASAAMTPGGLNAVNLGKQL
jgi:hypothetical protein